MATHATPNLAPVTEEAFEADRRGMWISVVHGGVRILIFAIVVLLLMAYFLT